MRTYRPFTRTRMASLRRDMRFRRTLLELRFNNGFNPMYEHAAVCVWSRAGLQESRPEADSSTRRVSRPMEEVREQVLGLVRKKTGKLVTPTDTFADLQLDSLSMAELAYEIEQALGIRTDEEVLDCNTVQEFIDYAIRLKSRQSGGRPLP
jgi:acyl carrier protein